MRQIASTDQNDIFVFFISQQAVGLKACFELKSLSLREGTYQKAENTMHAIYDSHATTK